VRGCLSEHRERRRRETQLTPRNKLARPDNPKAREKSIDVALPARYNVVSLGEGKRWK